MSIIDALANTSTKGLHKPTFIGNRVKFFQSQGIWEHWTVETSGWYTVIIKDNKANYPSTIKIYKGLTKKVEGPDVAAGGGFYFEMGDDVRAIVGASPSPSCVIVKSRRTGKDQMVVVAGGDLSMAFSQGWCLAHLCVIGLKLIHVLKFLFVHLDKEAYSISQLPVSKMSTNQT